MIVTPGAEPETTTPASDPRIRVVTALSESAPDATTLRIRTLSRRELVRFRIASSSVRLADAAPGGLPDELPVAYRALSGLVIEYEPTPGLNISVTFDLALDAGVRYVTRYFTRRIASIALEDGSNWTTPDAACIEADTDVPEQTNDGDMLLSSRVCVAGAVVAYEPTDTDTDDRLCPDGKYGCDCDKTSAWRADEAAGALYIIACFLLLVAFVLMRPPSTADYKSTRLTGSVSSGAACALLVAAAFLSDNLTESEPVVLDTAPNDATLLLFAVVPVGIAALASVFWYVGANREYVKPGAPSSQLPDYSMNKAAAVVLRLAVAAAFVVPIGTQRPETWEWLGPVFIGVAAPLPLAPNEWALSKWVRWLDLLFVTTGLAISAYTLAGHPCGTQYGGTRPYAELA